MEAILAAVDIDTIQAALVILFVAAVGIRVIFAGYKFVKSALARV
jgi:hypothetical protein